MVPEDTPVPEEADNQGDMLVTNARAQKTRESFKQIGERRVCEKEGGKTQPNYSPP